MNVLLEKGIEETVVAESRVPVQRALRLVAEAVVDRDRRMVLALDRQDNERAASDQLRRHRASSYRGQSLAPVHRMGEYIADDSNALTGGYHMGAGDGD